MEEQAKTMKVKVVVQTTEMLDKEIQLPYYSKSTSSANEFYRVEGDGSYQTMRVRWNPDNINDKYTSIDNAFNFNKAVGSDCVECSQDEYDKAFNEAQKFLFMQNWLSVQNQQLKKPLTTFIEKQISGLNENDIEGHIWWNKFLNLIRFDLINQHPQSEEVIQETTETK